MKKSELHKNWVCLGYILRPHGIKGALHVKLDNPNGQSIRPGVNIHLENQKGIVQDFEVASFVAQRLIQLEGIQDRNAAEKLAGSQIFIDRADLPGLNDDEIYLGDMIGFEVVDMQNIALGQVCGFSDNTAQVILEVRSSSGALGLIPFVKPLIQVVNESARRIKVDIPEGLFESDKADV